MPSGEVENELFWPLRVHTARATVPLIPRHGVPRLFAALPTAAVAPSASSPMPFIASVGTTQVR
jgi:hypothetical protein